MSYQVLARKYRPQKFSDVIGQEHVTRTLQNAISQERIAHGYIFSGHRGIGKTTVARILAMALNCRSAAKPPIEPCGICESCTEIRAGNAVDVIEIDAATNRGIDEIRELREAARYRPARDRFKIYILDEAHQITDAAFNALLKTLEEPPSHVVFMMATTQPEDIPQTIRSRCQHFSFRAVKFDDIMGQLRDIVTAEKIPADDDALALLAEAGDGSLRDALSILDQAIASTSDHLTLESVRSLIGAAPAAALETVMQSVSESGSEKILVLVDGLISEGHSPTHFARQLVRFLRNVTVAKIAGKDSALLQISSDERARVARIAELFSEEDLARHLQIMLRTHGELGYRQEQRFHLELGLLKMAHAQRLLPLEQLLSDLGPASSAGRTQPRPILAPASASRNFAPPSGSSTGEVRRGDQESTLRSDNVSPFAADSARKNIPKAQSVSESAAGEGTRSTRSGTTGTSFSGASSVAVMGATALAIEELPGENEPASEVAIASLTAGVVDVQTSWPSFESETTAPARRPGGETLLRTGIAEIAAQSPQNPIPQDQVSQAPATQPEATKSPSAPEDQRLRDAVLGALSNQLMLASMLETAEWVLNANSIVAKVSASPTMIEMSCTAEAKRTASAAASGAAGRPIKFSMEPGGVTQSAAPRPPASNGSARSRAEQDPVVQRMQEKFNAQIRTVIDYREKR